MVMVNSRTLAFVLFSGLLLGCVSAPTSFPYPNTGGKNLTISVNVKGGGFLTNVETYAVITDFAKGCPSQYLGYVDLSTGPNGIALSPGHPTYIAIGISQRTLGNGSNFRRGTFFTPQPGKRYEIAVNYFDDMFEMRVYVIEGTRRKEIPLAPRPSCNT